MENDTTHNHSVYEYTPEFSSSESSPSEPTSSNLLNNEEKSINNNLKYNMEEIAALNNKLAVLLRNNYYGLSPDNDSIYIYIKDKTPKNKTDQIPEEFNGMKVIITRSRPSRKTI